MLSNVALSQYYEANKMQTRLPYGTNVKKIREECLTEYANWTPPTGEEIKAALSMAGWTGVEFSKRAGVDDRTVRRWTGDEKEIPYAAWCVLCAEANLGLIW